ncbi:transformation/transcription domain-associated protein [Aphelenchoides avenae]|nr:transformation/transcription domain-associated protein [Aphelenchus avenae]
MGIGQILFQTAISPAEAAQPYWSVPMPPISLNDCRNMVRYLVQPMKMLTIWLQKVHLTNDTSPFDEDELYGKYFVHGLKCLDVFMVVATGSSSGPVYHRNSAQGSFRSKEEKEALETFSNTFIALNPAVFYNVLSRHLEFFVERIAGNALLQTVANAFLMNQATSAKVGDVLVRYLLKRLPEMGASNERATLYLRLFKLLFSAVTCKEATAEMEEMLKPHLHEIVRDSMQLSLRGREPMNYFLLLRALFRSIGSGTHDLLYQQFLPLLPSILQQLNRLQNGSHRQPIHELFVELCLTVPVRLSSLLPYLPLLMDPLVCALYGTPTLVQQGLRTLELCVDNLQPEYLYEHMAPIRSALMQGLWRTIGANDVPAAMTAIRILGKFGGTNRKILVDAQTLDYVDEVLEGPALSLQFTRSAGSSTSSQASSRSEQEDLLTAGLDGLGVASAATSTASSLSVPSASSSDLWADLPMERIVHTAVRTRKH